jgi:hypothetical protein
MRPGEDTGSGESTDNGLYTDSGEDTSDWEDMNSEEDIDDGEFTESDGVIKHYHPSRRYIENISLDFLEDATRIGYCIAVFALSAEVPVILHYVLGTYSFKPACIKSLRH